MTVIICFHLLFRARTPLATDPPAAILLVPVNRLAPVTPVQHMIDRSRLFDSGLSRPSCIRTVCRALSSIMCLCGLDPFMAKDADGAAIQMLDLGDVVQEGLRSGFSIHGGEYMCIPYTYATKKKRENQFEEFCPPPTCLTLALALWFNQFCCLSLIRPLTYE
jgi:hypothetical protein